MDILCRRLKQLRLDKHLTQEQFGDMLDVKKGTICYYEKGRNIPSIEFIALVADKFNLSMDYFVGHDQFIISEESEQYAMKMCKEEIRFIKDIRKNTRLHTQLLDSSENLINRMNLRL